MSKKIVSNNKITILTIILAIFMLYGGGCGPPKGKGRISITNTVDLSLTVNIIGKTNIERNYPGTLSASYDVLPGKYKVIAIWWDDSNNSHPQIVTPSSFDVEEGKTIEVVITAAPEENR